MNNYLKSFILGLAAFLALVTTQAKAKEHSLEFYTDSTITQPQPDTSNIQIGQSHIRFRVIADTTEIKLFRNNIHKKKRKKEFEGHWAGFDLGLNGLANAKYDPELYSNTDLANFMDMNLAKSIEININFTEFDISLNPVQTIGLVTGLGFTFNNYQFDNRITLVKTDGIIYPEEISSDNFKKSKLMMTYFTIPLMVEFHIPVNNHKHELSLAGGVLGGLNLGSHTKIKADQSKSKDRGSFNLNPFKGSAMVRLGVNNFCIYSTYGLTYLFKDQRGPQVRPYSIGLCFVGF